MIKNQSINIFMIGAIVLACFLSFTCIDGFAAEEIRIYQNGLDGYHGTDDAIITNLFVQDTNGNGVTARKGYLRAFHQFYEARSLIRFNNIALPSGADFVRAELKLVVTDWKGGMMLAGYYIDKPWDIESETLGWKNRVDDNTWSEPGGLADVIQGKSFILNGFSGDGVQEKVVSLDNEVVLNWLNHPSKNFGILISMLDKDASAWIHSSEDPEQAYRPQLIIYYE
ncbi:MAG: DNRLRE domain-containing protein [Candidatus Magnetomorum sp.]|nr:DNRLRE domain-containing protein [Candidatus Magnetomorum sp.]